MPPNKQNPPPDGVTFSEVQTQQRQTPKALGTSTPVLTLDTVRVRATRRGYYGLPMIVQEGAQKVVASNAIIRNEGDVFDMDAPTGMECLDHVTPERERSMKIAGIMDADGNVAHKVTTQTGTYLLPSWVEIATKRESREAEAPTGHRTVFKKTDDDVL